MEKASKVLGVWNKEIDCIVYRLDEVVKKADEIKRTKRGLLRAIASIYDPLGFISPLVIFEISMQRWRRMG